MTLTGVGEARRDGGQRRNSTAAMVGGGAVVGIEGRNMGGYILERSRPKSWWCMWYWVGEGGDYGDKDTGAGWSEGRRSWGHREDSDRWGNSVHSKIELQYKISHVILMMPQKVRDTGKCLLNEYIHAHTVSTGGACTYMNMCIEKTEAACAKLKAHLFCTRTYS